MNPAVWLPCPSWCLPARSKLLLAAFGSTYFRSVGETCQIYCANCPVKPDAKYIPDRDKEAGHVSPKLLYMSGFDTESGPTFSSVRFVTFICQVCEQPISSRLSSLDAAALPSPPTGGCSSPRPPGCAVCQHNDDGGPAGWYLQRLVMGLQSEICCCIPASLHQPLSSFLLKAEV